MYFLFPEGSIIIYMFHESLFDVPPFFLTEATHQFNARESDWGFTAFMPLADLYDSSKGYVVNDKCIIEAEVAVRRIVDYWNYDSKKVTGFVGLKNQGATCYMNSLLQTLYHIPFFRKVESSFVLLPYG
jgi:hypothetical protein